MGDLREPREAVDRERMLAALAARDGGESVGALAASDEATLVELKAELDTIAAELREPPADEFSEESDCRRAVELVESVGRSEERSSGAAWESLPADDHATPTRIGPYDVTAKLGEGGMGAVYKAVHPRLKRTVAIKVLPARRIKSAASIARFEREMEAIGSLNHPNIVAAHDAGEDAGMHYLVMEYVDGLDLAALVRRVGPLAPADACEIVRQAAQGLAAAAVRGIVHRDVKPSNLMLAETSVGASLSMVKILDFGLARLSPLQADEGEFTVSGLILGTLKYLAPEQCSGSHAVDVRTDIYALGATLYKLLCGSSPFAEERFNSPLALLAALGGEEPPRLESRQPDVPPPLADIVHRMMAKQPADRFASPEEVAAALEPWAVGADLTALLHRARAADAPAAKSPIPGRLAAPVSLPRGAEPKSAPGRAILGGLALVAALGAAFLLFREDADPALARNRSAAEWLALHNARLVLALEDGGFADVTAAAPLPDGNFQLNLVDLNQDKLIRDQDMGRFHGLAELQALNVSHTNIGDEGVRRMAELPRLQHLFLAGARVTDAGVAHLVQFQTLTTLFLARTAITDASLAHAAKLPALGELSLVDCRVTDEGLAALESLPNLRVLYLQGTQVTAAGVGRLQLAAPACSVQSDFTDQEIASASAADDAAPATPQDSS